MMPHNSALYFHHSGLLGQLSVEPVFGWLTAIPLAIIMLASLWLTLSARDLSPKQRFALATIRLLAIAVLLVAWFRPGLVTTVERESPGAIAILLDRSESMTLPSGDSDESRWQAQQRVWQQIQQKTSLKIGRSDIVPYFYDSALTAASTAEDPSLSKSFGTPPDGNLTDLGSALEQLTRTQLDPPLRGVLLLGDYSQTQTPAAVPATSISRQMAQLDQPILAIGIGPVGGKQYRDVALEGLPEDIATFSKKELRIPIDVRANGLAGEPILVQVTLKASGKPDVILGSRKVTPSRGSEMLPIGFDIVAPEKGDYLIEATVSVDAREQITSNNSQYGFLSVREGGARILYLEGELRSEMTFLQRSLDESLEFEVERPTELLARKNHQRGQPVDLLRKYNVANYDAIIIGDVAARELGRDMQIAIRNHVERSGAGLLLIGGMHSFAAGGYAGSPLERLFPMQLTGRPQKVNAAIDERLHVLGDVRMTVKRPHAVTRLAPSAPENTAIWQSLPPLDQINRFGPLDVSAGTSTLLESPRREPILVVSDGQGRGRVMAFAGDTTWTWRLAGFKKMHQRFWRQAMLWLVRKEGIDVGFKLSLPRRRFQLGEAPKIDVEWFGGVNDQVAPANFRIALSREGRWLSDIAFEKVSDNLFTASVQPIQRAGLYSAQLTASGPDGQAYESEVAFVVSNQSIELTSRTLDEQMLRSIVAANSTAGGRVVLTSELDDALNWLRTRQDNTKVTSIEKRQLGDAAWDSWLYLLVFCGLMTLEWSLRKSWQLP